MAVRHLLVASLASIALLNSACSHINVSDGRDPVAAATRSAPPATDKRPVTDTYHGVSVTEDYRWLEDWNDPAVKAWSDAQNTYARAHLDSIAQVPKLRTRITQLMTGSSIAYHDLRSAGGLIFALKQDPSKQQPLLVTMQSASAPERQRTLVDPNTIDTKGLTTIDWYHPSPDGKLVAVSMSEGGSESGTVHVFRVADGSRTGDVIPRAHGGTAGGSLAWFADSSGFLYTRYPRDGERPADDMDFYVNVYSHKLGTPTSADTYELGRDFPKIAEIIIDTSDDGRTALVGVQNGDGGEFMHFVKPLSTPGATWRQLTRWEDRVVQMIVTNDALYAVSRKNAPRGFVTKASLTDPALNFSTIVSTTSNSIQTDFFDGKGVKFAGGKLLVQYQTGGPNAIEMYDTAGKPLGRVRTPEISSIDEVATLGSQVLINAQSFTLPPAWYTLAADGSVTPTNLVTTSAADYSDCTVTAAKARSKDGTMVPLYIIHKKSVTPDGSNPAIVWGYGGYGVCETPVFSPKRRVWIENGGIFVTANIRGGGEFGEEWHLGGNLLNKQNVFNDFAAVCDWLVDNNWTNRSKLGIMGGSNGGLLMGATLTQRPGICKTVCSSVGIYDMLRVELSANGAFNVTEFGTVKDPAQFKALYAYSPLHNVRDNVKYPSVLFLTGANDPRVDPMQSRKMTARLQAASPDSLTLLRTSANSGHGIGSSLAQRIEEAVDIYGWFFSELGVNVK